MPDSPFNPLDKKNLAQSLAEAVLKAPLHSLPPRAEFAGAGIYAIYYRGDFAPYRPLKRKASHDDEQPPIYVGKAVPPGARKGGFELGGEPGYALSRRLREHSNSIREVSNLNIRDFSCRYLVCDDIWIPLGESLLIERFRPLWNVLIEGFGIHTPGKGRNKQVKSKWDTIHPGRRLANGLPVNPMSSARITRLVADFLADKRVPALTPAEAMIEEEKEKSD